LDGRSWSALLKSGDLATLTVITPDATTGDGGGCGGSFIATAGIMVIVPPQASNPNPKPFVIDRIASRATKVKLVKSNHSKLSQNY
jgi:hypothetical protein